MSTSFIYPLTETPVKAGFYEANPMSSSNAEIARKMLCKPVSYASIQNYVCTRHFLENHITVSMRLLCLATDLPVIYNWLPWKYTVYLKKEAHVKHLHETYSYIADSSSAQSFMMLMNNAAIAQADVYQAAQDDISTYYKAIPGDYRVQLLVDPEKEMNGDNSLFLLQTCTEFFFTFQEVERVVIVVEDDSFLLTKLERAGYAFETKVVTAHKAAKLFTCSRSNFKAQ